MVVPTVIGLLKADTVIKGLIDDCIYPVAIPQTEARPGISVLIMGNTPTASNDPKSPVDTLNFGVYVEGKTYAKLEQLAHRVREVLVSYRGHKVDQIWFSTENDQEYDPMLEVYTRLIYFKIRFDRNAS